MNPFGATLVLLLTARDAKRIAAASKLPRTISADCGTSPVPRHRCVNCFDGVAKRRRI